MKKTYIQPEIKTYQMVVSKMMMTSTTSVSIQSGEYNEGTMTDLSRSFDFDDEDY